MTLSWNQFPLKFWLELLNRQEIHWPTLTHIDPHWPTFIRWCLVLCTERSESFLALPRPLRSNCFDPGAATSETNARDLSLKLESSVQGCKCSGKAFSFLPRYYLLIFIMRSSHMDLVSTRPSDNICFDWSVFFPGFVEICGIKQCFWKLRKTNGDFTWYDDVGKFVQLHTGCSQDLDPKEQPLKVHNTITYYTLLHILHILHIKSKHWSVMYDLEAPTLLTSWSGFPMRSVISEINCPRMSPTSRAWVLKSFDRKRKIMKDTQGVASTSPWQLRTGKERTSLIAGSRLQVWCRCRLQKHHEWIQQIDGFLSSCEQLDC